MYVIQTAGACPQLYHLHIRRGCSEHLLRIVPPSCHPMQLYNLNSQYGNEQELRELNRKLREAGIR